MERWWARQDSNLGPRDYESHEQNPHGISNLKNPEGFSDEPSAEIPKPNLDTELGRCKSKKQKEPTDRNRSQTEPIGPNSVPVGPFA
jgi:hypothetical protein